MRRHSTRRCRAHRSARAVLASALLCLAALPWPAAAQTAPAPSLREEIAERINAGFAGVIDATTQIAELGDLDGDGLPDVVRAVDDNQGRRVLVAHRGVDGEILWTARREARLVGVLPGMISPDAKGGVILVLVGSASTTATPVGERTQYPIRYEAIGHDGDTLWVQEEIGTLDVIGTRAVLRGVPIGVALLDGGDAPDRLVVQTWDGVRVEGSEPRDVYRSTVLAGPIGDVLGVAVTAAPGANGGVRPLPLPDLTGDGVGELGVVLRDQYGYQDLFVHSGADATPRWRSTTVAAKPTAEILPVRVGDATGDGVADLVLFSPSYNLVRGTAYFFDGATGVERWQRRDVRPYELGDIDGDGAREIGLAALLLTGDEVVASFDAVDDAGVVVRSTHRQIDPLKGGGVAFSFDILDADADGFGDVAYTAATYHPGTFDVREAARGVWSGRTGEPFWDGATDERAIANFAPIGATSGEGQDLLSVALEGEYAEVALDAVTGSTIWQQPRFETRTFYRFQTMADFDGDGADDLLYADETPWLGVRSGVDGTLRWNGGFLPGYF